MGLRHHINQGAQGQISLFLWQSDDSHHTFDFGCIFRKEKLQEKKKKKKTQIKTGNFVETG